MMSNYNIKDNFFSYANVLLAIVLLATSFLALSCPKKITVSNIVDTFVLGEKAQNNYKKQLKKCIVNNKNLQAQLDTAVVLSILPYNLQKKFVTFSADLLKINAEAGFASSEHNYAMLHNADPRSVLYKLIPVNYKTFVYWDRKAAVAGDPRALFNIAVRMMAKQPVESINPDPKTAYIIFTYLKNNYFHNPGLPQPFMHYVNKFRKELIKLLGNNEIKKLNIKLKTFKFSGLAEQIKSN